MRRGTGAGARLALLAVFLAASSAAGCRSTPPEPPLTSSSDRPPEVQSALAAAAEAYQRGNLFQTKELLRRAAGGAPDDCDIALDLGDTLNRLGHNEAARDHYARFLARHPSAWQVRQALGLTLISLGRWGEARDEFRKLVGQRPRDPSALFSLGTALNRLGRYEEALSPLKEAAAISPGDSAIQTEMGIASLKLNRLPEAAAALRTATEIDPFNVPALHNLGNCYARMDRRQEARAVLEQFNRASSRKEQFINDKRLFQAARSKANELTAAGKPEKALVALAAYRTELLTFAPFHQEMGIVLLRLGKKSEAMEAFQRALDLDPGLVEARAHLISLYQQAGETDKAMKLREAAARQAADARTTGVP